MSSVAAGIREEVLLFAIPIALARLSGWSTPATIALVTVLRLAVHIYYGWGSAFVVLWIPAGVRRVPGGRLDLAAHRRPHRLRRNPVQHRHVAGRRERAGQVNLAAALFGAVVTWIGDNRYWRDRSTGRRALPAIA